MLCGDNASVLSGEIGRGDFFGGRFFRFGSGVVGDLGSGEISSPDNRLSLTGVSSQLELPIGDGAILEGIDGSGFAVSGWCSGSYTISIA